LWCGSAIRVDTSDIRLGQRIDWTALTKEEENSTPKKKQCCTSNKKFFSKLSQKIFEKR